jgi:uncharacterized protein (DUF486 family)
MINQMTYLLIIILPIISAFLNMTATYTQTLPFMSDSTIIHKILTSESWSTLNAFVYIPYLRIANKYLNPAQLMLYGYLTSFVVILFTNKYIFISPTSYDDYIAMIIMFIAMTISGFKLFD